MTRQNTSRPLNYSHAVLIGGLGLSLLTVMLRPAAAEAALPRSVEVFETAGAAQDGPSATLRLNELPMIVNVDYNVTLNGQKKPKMIGLTGVPLLEILTRGGAKADGVNFVKIRYGVSDDSIISLIPLGGANTERPPMILASGTRPGLGPFKTPAIVPGQPDLSQPIRESSFVPFNAKGPRLSFVPGAPGAKIMGIRIVSKRRKNGQYFFSARVLSGGSKSALRSYQWYGFDSKGQSIKLGTAPSMQTSDATAGSSRHTVTVVVAERGTGSTGTSAVQYISRKKLNS